MATFLLEVGTEELPASFVKSALAQWRSQVPQSLDECTLTGSAVEVYGTPRRLAILIRDIPCRQPDQVEDLKGPPAQAAFKAGKPTRAAVGFAHSRGVELSALEVRRTEKGEFVFVRRQIAGRPTVEILPQLVPAWILGLEGLRFMRWGNGDLRFSRPIRWLVALWDEEILPIELVNGSETIKSDRISQGHRVLHPKPVILEHAQDYVERLNQASVQVALEQRQALIEQQVEAKTKEIGGAAGVPTRLYPDLLQEVTNLVEKPSAVVGKFDPEFLSLPPEVITTVMVSHQRYFPIARQGTAELLPYFITISNGDPGQQAIIAAGNERVIRARLSDGKFFYQADLAQSLESYLPRLEKVTFQEKLGSMFVKAQRLGKIAVHIADQLQLNDNIRADVQRAALLCKADLVTQMVGEFPELQGIMGQKYALASGETGAVATAISEHYLPRSAEDQLPQSQVGQVVGLADRLDTLVSIFGLGMLPTGSSDPFALRRAANAVVNITWAAALPLNLLQLLQQISLEFVAAFPQSQPLEALRSQLCEYFLQRIRSLLEERGLDYDLINAVLPDSYGDSASETNSDPEYAERALKDLVDVLQRADFLQSIRANGSLAKIYETVNRASRLAKQGDLRTSQLDPAQVIQPELLQQASEQAFYQALLELVPQTQAVQQERDYTRLIAALSQIAPIVNRFFDGPDSVLVMDTNPEIRRNRLNLLGLLRNHARVLADFGPIVKSFDSESRSEKQSSTTGKR